MLIRGRDSDVYFIILPNQDTQMRDQPDTKYHQGKISIWGFFFSFQTGKTRTREKYRVVYTDQQRLELEKEFHYNRYITIRRKSEMAANLRLSERQVEYGLYTTPGARSNTK